MTIITTLPSPIVGQYADAGAVNNDLNWIVDHVNRNVAPTNSAVVPATGVADNVAITNAIASIGTGTIFLNDSTYVFAASVTVPSGITIIGVPPTFVNSGNNNVFDAGRVYSSGTRILGNGTATYDAFVGNNTNPGSPVNPGFGNNTLDNVTIRDMYIDGFRYPMQFGAANNMGLYGARIFNIWTANNKYPCEFHNFVHSDFDRLFDYTTNATYDGGFHFVGSVASSSILTPGNSRIGQVECLKRSKYNKGLVIESLTGSQLNQLDCHRLESYAFGSDGNINDSAIFTSGSANVQVPDSSIYRVDFPCILSGNVGSGPPSFFGGAGNYRNYFVTSIVDATHITLASMMGGTPIVSNGNATVTLVSSGYASITVIGRGAPNTIVSGVINSKFRSIDVEGAAGGNYLTATVAGVVGQCIADVEFEWNCPGGAFTNDSVLRGTTDCRVMADYLINTDWDDGAYLTQYIGNGRGTINNRRGWGIWNGHTTGMPMNGTATPGAVAQIGTGGVVAIGYGSTAIEATMSQGMISITTGTGTLTPGKLCTLISNVAKEFFIVNLFPLNAAALGVMPNVHMNSNDVSGFFPDRFEVWIDTVGLAASTTYRFGYTSP